MQTTISITRQWQIYLPKSIRKLLKVNAATKLKAQVKNGQLILTPTQSSVLKLAAKYQKKYQQEPVKLEKIREKIDYSNL